jgi:hypothetical protein
MQMTSADTSSLRSHNSLLLLRHVRDLEPVSAKVLVEKTGMRASSVSRLLRVLATKGLVASRGIESGTGTSGRPTEYWGLNGSFGASIGLYLASNMVAGVTVDLTGKILDTSVVPFRNPESLTPDRIHGFLSQALDRLTTGERLRGHEIIGVGVASMGLVDRENHRIRYFDASVDLGGLAAFGGGCLHLENDANVVARGEAMHGSLAGVRNAVVLYAHEGIGAGLIVNGNLMIGSGGAAGEVGYRACQLISNPLDSSAHDVLERFYNGTCSIINLLNPEVLLLTGDLESLSGDIVATLRERIAVNTNKVAGEVRLMVAPCDPMGVARHIATIVLDEEVFTSDTVLHPARLPELESRQEAG